MIWPLLAGVLTIAAVDPTVAGSSPQTPESKWLEVPDAAAFRRCFPGSTDIRPGRVTVRCYAGQDGLLSRCETTGEGADPRLGPWAVCLAGHFRAKPAERNAMVEFHLTYENAYE